MAINSREQFLAIREKQIEDLMKAGSKLDEIAQQYSATCSPWRYGDKVRVLGRGKSFLGIIEQIMVNDLGDFTYRVRAVRRNGKPGKRVVASVRVDEIEKK